MTLAAPTYYERVALGLIPDAQSVSIRGFHSALPTTLETIWPGAVQGAGYEDPAMPLAGVAMFVASDAPADSVALVGARSVSGVGLTAAGVAAPFAVALAGLTPVAIGTFARILSWEVDSVGASGVNAGRLWIGSGVFTLGIPPALTAFSAMEPGANFAENGFYTVRVSRRLILRTQTLSADSNKSLEFSLFVNENPGGSFAAPAPSHRIDHTDVQIGAVPFFSPFADTYAPIGSFVDVMLKGRVDTTSGGVAVNLQGALLPGA